MAILLEHSVGISLFFLYTLKPFVDTFTRAFSYSAFYYDLFYTLVSHPPLFKYSYSILTATLEKRLKLKVTIK